MTEFQKIVINLVNEGNTVTNIAKMLGRNVSSVSSVVKRFNLNPVKAFKNTVDNNFFDKIDSEQKAYLLGFFIADGCINKDTPRSKGRFSISQSEDDKEVVEAFKKYLNVPTEISIVNCQIGAKFRKPQLRLRWTSPHMKDSLKTLYGITSNKTSDSNFEFPINTIPNDLINHFVRGFIDGDGYMGNNGEINNFSVSIVGTSKKFISMLGDIIANNTGMTYKIYENIGKTITYYSLRWSCNRTNKLDKITKLQEYLYKNATIFLKRKKEKIDAYIKYRANALNNINAQCNAQEMNLEDLPEYNFPTSERPLTGNAEGENIC